MSLEQLWRFGRLLSELTQLCDTCSVRGFTRECLCFAKCRIRFSVCDKGHPFVFPIFGLPHVPFLSSPSLSFFQASIKVHQLLLVKSPKQTAVASLREMAAQIPLWQQITTSMEDGGLKSIFDLANVHADIFQEITGGEGIKTLREFVSSWEERDYEKRLTRWIDRNVPSCKGMRYEGSRLKLAWKAGFDRIQNDDNLTKNGGSSATKKEDWEDELPSGEKEKMEEDFNNMQHVVVDNPVFPCDPLTNRIWREFRRWQMSVNTAQLCRSWFEDCHEQWNCSR